MLCAQCHVTRAGLWLHKDPSIYCLLFNLVKFRVQLSLILNPIIIRGIRLRLVSNLLNYNQVF